MQREEDLKMKAEAERKRKLAMEIEEDFLRRREERRALESAWALNVEFLKGNQYVDVSPLGGVEEEEKRFYWQNKRCFNHVAPTIDARMAKLTRLRPKLKVRAFSDEDGDVKSAKISTGVLDYVRDRVGLNGVVSDATLWSETCGTAFYKIVWDENGGRKVGVDENGNDVYEGEVSVAAVSPFEVFPDSLQAEGLKSVKSLIHAQEVDAGYVYESFGVTVEDNGEKIVLIERYTAPTKDFPDGKLEIVASGLLLYEGPLPYLNGERGTRVFPFVKQDCLRVPGNFYGISVVDRLVPVQRAYNAVRNRKHELLNRLSMGVVTVEDGSLDTDELAEEGISPGKILVYRQGGKAPEMLECGEIPKEFQKEEEWLEKEFTLISGVSDLSQNSMPSSVTSASGLRLLLNEDNARISVTTENLCEAMKEVGRHILRLYKAFAGNARLMTLSGENKKTEVFYFNAEELSSSDILFDTEEPVTAEERQETIMRLLEAGLFSDADGRLTEENKHRILEAFGYGSYENVRDISSLHIGKASEENRALLKGDANVDFYDDHDLHILEHTRFLLSDEFKRKKDDKIKQRFCLHMAEHETMKNKKEKAVENA